MIMKICIGVFVGIGLFMILADHFRIPYMRTSKAVNNLAKQQKENTSSIDVWLSSLASFIARKLKLNEFKRGQLESDLRTAQVDITPEMFMANAIVKSLIIISFCTLEIDDAFLYSIDADGQELFHITEPTLTFREANELELVVNYNITIPMYFAGNEFPAVNIPIEVTSVLTEKF